MMITEEQYLDPEFSMIPADRLELLDEIGHLRAAARHWKAIAEARDARVDELQRRINELLDPTAPTFPDDTGQDT